MSHSVNLLHGPTNMWDFLTKQGLSFTSLPAISGEKVVIKIGEVELKGWDEAKYTARSRHPATRVRPTRTRSTIL